VAENHKSNTFAVLFWIGIVLVLGMGGVMAIFWKTLPPELPWFYSLPTGDSQLINKMWLIWILAGMGGLLVMTRLIARWAGKNDATVQTTIMIGGIMAVILMAASFVKIMMIFLNV
jgi:hypothetical protein